MREGYQTYPVTDAVGGTTPEAHRAGWTASPWPTEFARADGVRAGRWDAAYATRRRPRLRQAYLRSDQRSPGQNVARLVLHGLDTRGRAERPAGL